MKGFKRKGSIREKLLVNYVTLIVVMIVITTVGGCILSRVSMDNVKYTMMKSRLESDVYLRKQLLSYKYGSIEQGEDTLVATSGSDLYGDEEWVDSLSKDDLEETTVFAKTSEGYKRIATTIIDEETGERIIGTSIENTSPIVQAVETGGIYIGDNVINGQPYMCAYAPIEDSQGMIIGMLFTGVPEADLLTLIRHELNLATSVFLIIGVGVILISILITIITAIHISKPLEKAAAYTNVLGQLDLSDEMPPLVMKQNNEIGDLGKSIVSLREALCDVMGETIALAEEVSVRANDLGVVTDYVNKTSEEISLVGEQIADGASHQANNTQDGAMHVENLGILIGDAGKGIESLKNAAGQVAHLKDEGVILINQLSEESIQTQKEVELSYQNILRTKEKSDIITRASEKIKAIASQTSLLALNASIEAARTGEEGKGFVVIATEIRKLAEQADRFTAEIEQNIKDLSETSAGAVEAMQRITTRIDNQADSVKDTQSKFNGIADAIENTWMIINDVLKMQQQMTAKRDEIIDIMQTLSAIAEENAAATQEVAGSIKEQTESVDNMNELAKKLEAIAVHLKETVNQFKF